MQGYPGAMVDPEQLKMPIPHAGKLQQANALMGPAAEQMQHMPQTPKSSSNGSVGSDSMKKSSTPQGWFVADDKWGRFRFTKGAAKKGCAPNANPPVWFCSKCKDEGKDGLLPLSEFMPYGPECGNPNDKENNKIWSRYMLSGCVYLCKKHADEHIAFMKHRREEVASKKKEEAMLEASKNEDGKPGDYKRYKTPKKQDLSMKKLQNTLTNVLKKFSPKASIAVLMSHEDDPGNLASYHVGSSLDNFCSDAYVRSLFLLCGTRSPQGQHLNVMNQGHDLILQQMQNLTKQYTLLIRQLQNVTRQQQVQNITKQYGLIVSQLQNVARNPGVLEASVARGGIQGVPAMPAMTGVPGVPGMTMGVDAHTVAMPSPAQLAGQMQFVTDGTSVPDPSAKLREASENKARADAKAQKVVDMAGNAGQDKVPMDTEKQNPQPQGHTQAQLPAIPQIDMSNKRPREENQQANANKRPKN
uniref:Uncharacterized protein n=1 Tax=Norrisiella sphaerica TaxID=552664 RepID=A0A7S2QRU7_9EUKA|mmetsp:Transcript_1403/g.1927  ORF Transcript_1403/g.1927 Transcript_1403/m.1927 type:complete len:471 (+) Transcript_1403:119-1531(+)